MRSHAEQVFFFLFFCEISWTCSFSLHCEIRAWIHETHWHQIWPLCVAASTLSRRRTDSRSVLRAALARECSSGIRPFGWSDVFIARVGRGTSQQQRIGSAPPCLRGCLHINLCECVRGNVRKGCKRASSVWQLYPLWLSEISLAALIRLVWERD